MTEAARWCPSLRMVRFHGILQERARLEATECVHGKFDCIVTTYEVIRGSKTFFIDKIVWYASVPAHPRQSSLTAFMFLQALCDFGRSASR
jgi:hypothetical protein